MRTRWTGFVGANGCLTVHEVAATLGKSDAESEGKCEPPWVRNNFSFAFTGQPPLECYADLEELQ